MLSNNMNESNTMHRLRKKMIMRGEVFRKRSLSDGNLALRLSASSERGFSNCQTISVVRGDKRVAVAAREIANPTCCGFLDCWEHGEWRSYWSVLYDSSLYRYTSPDDKATTDLVALRGYEVITCHAFKGRDLVFQLVHPDGSMETFSCESVEEYERWLECLREAVEDMTISGLNLEEGRSKEFDEVHAGSLNSDGVAGQWQQQLLQLRKQQLLQELLQQKSELQASLQKNVPKHTVKHEYFEDGDDVSLSSRISTSGERPKSALSYSHGQTRPKSLCLGVERSKGSSAYKGVSHEQTMRDVTHLKQRKISTQLKVESLEKRLENFQNRKQKRKFKLGLGLGKPADPPCEAKTVPANHKHLERELLGLKEELGNIDQCLEQRRHKTLLEEVIAAPVVLPTRKKGYSNLMSSGGRRDRVSTSSDLSNRSRDFKKSLSSVGSTPTSEIGDSFDMSASSTNSDIERGFGANRSPTIPIRSPGYHARHQCESTSQQGGKSESLDSLEDLLDKMSQLTPTDARLPQSWDNLIPGNSAPCSLGNSNEGSPKLTPETVTKHPLTKRSTVTIGESEHLTNVKENNKGACGSGALDSKLSISQDSLAKIAAFEELLHGTFNI